MIPWHTWSNSNDMRIAQSRMMLADLGDSNANAILLYLPHLTKGMITHLDLGVLAILLPGLAGCCWFIEL